MSIINFLDNQIEALDRDPVAELTSNRGYVVEVAPSFLDVARDALLAREQSHGAVAVNESIDVVSEPEPAPVIPIEEGLTPEQQQNRDVAIARAAAEQAYRDEMRLAA